MITISKKVYVTEDNEILGLEISVVNNNDIPAPNVVVQIVYPGSFVYYDHIGSGTYNQNTKKWTIESVPGPGGRVLLLFLEITDISMLPLDVTWSASTDAEDPISANDDCGKWTVAFAPSSTAANCTKYLIKSNVLCDKEIACGCDTLKFTLGTEVDGAIIALDQLTGDYYGHAYNEAGNWSFTWSASCRDDSDVATSSYGPFTVTNAGFGNVAEVSTGGVVATPILLFGSESNKIYEVDYTVQAKTSSSLGVYKRLFRFKNQAGALSVLNESVSGTDYIDGALVGATVVGSVSGTNAYVTVTGLPGTDITWETNFKIRGFNY